MASINRVLRGCLRMGDRAPADMAQTDYDSRRKNREALVAYQREIVFTYF